MGDLPLSKPIEKSKPSNKVILQYIIDIICFLMDFIFREKEAEIQKLKHERKIIKRSLSLTMGEYRRYYNKVIF